MKREKYNPPACRCITCHPALFRYGPGRFVATALPARPTKPAPDRKPPAAPPRPSMIERGPRPTN